MKPLDTAAEIDISTAEFTALLAEALNIKGSIKQ